MRACSDLLIAANANACKEHNLAIKYVGKAIKLHPPFLVSLRSAVPLKHALVGKLTGG